MRIYLDESKRLWEWKIVFGWFISTKHSHSYIENFIKNKKEKYNIDSKLEIKGSKDLWKLFYNRMIKENYFEILDKNIIWIKVSWYKENLINYKYVIKEIVNLNNNFLKTYKKDIIINADYVNLWKKTRKIELDIEKYLNNEFSYFWKIKFNFEYSVNKSTIQLADLISYKIWKNFFFDEDLDDFILENLFNIDLSKKFVINKKV
jgi:hypothetical protein